MEDMFLGITTSGLRVLEQCWSTGLTSTVFATRDGGNAKALADYCTVAHGGNTATIQELHIVLAHTLCGCVESSLLNNIS